MRPVFKKKAKDMKLAHRIILALVVGAAAGGGVMFWDKQRGAEWVVSPQQVATARDAGQTGVATRPGTVAVRPIRSEIAGVLPYKWGLYGIGAALLTLVVTRRRNRAGDKAA